MLQIRSQPTTGITHQIPSIVYSLSRVRLFVTPWTAAYQAPLSMGSPRQEYCSGLPFPLPGDLAKWRTKPVFLHWQVDTLLLSHQGSHDPIYYLPNHFRPVSLPSWRPRPGEAKKSHPCFVLFVLLTHGSYAYNKTVVLHCQALE